MYTRIGYMRGVGIYFVYRTVAWVMCGIRVGALQSVVLYHCCVQGGVERSKEFVSNCDVSDFPFFHQWRYDSLTATYFLLHKMKQSGKKLALKLPLLSPRKTPTTPTGQ